MVVLRPGIPVTQAELAGHTAEPIARYKVPTRWVLRTGELPRNATGKVARADMVAALS